MSHPSPQEFVAALRQNAHKYGRGDITHEKFSAGNKQIWSAVDRAGRATHEAVLDLLRQGNAAGHKTAPTPMTSGELATLLKERLRPYAKQAMISVRSSYYEGMLPGTVGSVMVTFAAVPAGSPEIEALNARESFMVTLEAPAWDQGATRRRVHEGGALDVAVDQVKLRQFRGMSKVRGVTGTPEKVADVVVAAVVSALSRAGLGAGHNAGEYQDLWAFTRMPPNVAIYTDVVKQALLERHDFTKAEADALLNRPKTKTWVRKSFRAQHGPGLMAYDLSKAHPAKAAR